MTIGEFPYAQMHGRFAGCAALQDHPLAVVGVPWDGSVSHRTGARMAPQSIRAASQMLCDATHPVFDISPLPFLGDGGNLRLPNASGLAAARTAMLEQAMPLVRKHHCVFLGGDHAISLAMLRAIHATHGPVALLHFDAHCDTWSDHFGEPSGHGTWTREAIEQGLVSAQHTVQVGLRSAAERGAREYVRDQGGMIYHARDLWGMEGTQLNAVLQAVRERVGQRPIYLTLDIDCLDPAYAPGTGTPEPGGLTTRQVLTWIEGLSELNWVGMDCVEVCPAYDHAELTSLAASSLVWSYLSGQAARLQRRQLGGHGHGSGRQKP
jgi:agmatinase